MLFGASFSFPRQGCFLAAGLGTSWQGTNSLFLQKR